MALRGLVDRESGGKFEKEPEPFPSLNLFLAGSSCSLSVVVGERSAAVGDAGSRPSNWERERILAGEGEVGKREREVGCCGWGFWVEAKDSRTGLGGTRSLEVRCG